MPDGSLVSVSGLNLNLEEIYIYACPCSQFARFLKDRVKLNRQQPELYDTCDDLGFADIRQLLYWDESALKELNMKKPHAQMFMRKVKVFQDEATKVRGMSEPLSHRIAWLLCPVQAVVAGHWRGQLERLDGCVGRQTGE